MREQIEAIVFDCLKDALSGIEPSHHEELTMNTRLYGAKGVLDSIALVSLIADIEDRVGQEFGRNVILADEKAMSQRLSPFGRVSLLVEYIERLLQEE
jgi:acyl carrier protein